MEAKQEGLENPDVAFAKRLARVRAAGAAAPGQGSQDQQRQEVSMIDFGRPQYDSPPPLTKTLFGAGGDGSPGSEGSGFGLPQVRPRLLFIAVLHVVSSGVNATAPRVCWTYGVIKGNLQFAEISKQLATACIYKRHVLAAPGWRGGWVAGFDCHLHRLKRWQRPGAKHAALAGGGRPGRQHLAARRRGAARPASAGSAL